MASFNLYDLVVLNSVADPYLHDEDLDPDFHFDSDPDPNQSDNVWWQYATLFVYFYIL
jgi:hypothetical protein